MTVLVTAAGPAEPDPQSIYEAATVRTSAASFTVDNGVDPFGLGALGGDFDVPLDLALISSTGRLALGFQGFGYGADGHGPLASFSPLQLRVVGARAVPEPASITTLGVGALAALGLWGRRPKAGTAGRGSR